MNYHSTFALCLSADAEKKLHAFYNEARKTLNSEDLMEVKNFIESPDTLQKENDAVLRYWGWREGYPEFFTKFLLDLDYSSYLFCRIGEELDDIERDGGFYDNPFELNVSVTIEFNSYN